MFHEGDMIGIGFAALCVLLAGFWPFPLRPLAVILLALLSFGIGLWLAVTWS